MTSSSTRVESISDDEAEAVGHPPSERPSNSLYQSLALGQIRVLLIKDAADSDLSIEMRTINLEQQTGIGAWLVSSSNQYHALSYYWGDEQEPKKSIMCNDRRIEIQSNLYSALHALRQRKLKAWVWADAICINQDDEHEKRAQIRIMGKIYSNARQVWAFVGDAPTGMLELMAQLPNVCRACSGMEGSTQWTLAAMQPQNWGVRSAAYQRASNLPPHESPLWQALFSVMTRDYFDRLWILQEVALGRKVDFLCGTETISLDEMRLLFRFALQLQPFQQHIPRLFQFNKTAFDVRSLVYPDGSGWTGWLFPVIGKWALKLGENFAKKYKSNLEEVGMYDILEDTWTFLKANNLNHALAYTRTQHCSKPEDRILAITGILGFQLDLDSYPWMEKTTPEEVYMEAFYFIARFDRSLSMFCMASPDSKSPLSLPSWCPNFHRERDPIKLEEGFSGMVYPEWQASKLKQKIYRGLDPRRLSLNAIPLGNVGVMEERWQTLNLTDERQPQDELQAKLKANAQWLKRCYTLAHLSATANGRGTAEEIAERFWRLTFLEQLHLLGLEDLTGNDFVKVQDFLDRATSPLSSYEEEKKILAATQAGSSADARRPSEILVLGVMDMRMRDKVFFYTNDGYFGLAFPGVQDGDTLVVFHGAKVPHLLRREDASSWTFVSEAYVPGIMFGEAEDPASGNAPVTEPFVLV